MYLSHSEKPQCALSILTNCPLQVKQGRALIAGLALSSTVAGALAARWLRTHSTLETTDVSKWYIAGSVLAGVHLASLPIIAQPVGRIIKANEKDDASAERSNREEMKTWLTIHTVRTLVVDVSIAYIYVFRLGGQEFVLYANECD